MWDQRRHQFDLFTSELVLEEVAEGEPAKAAERMQMLSGLTLLALNERVEALAMELLERRILPMIANRDASHLAAAGVHGMNFILTWNYKHIANPFLADRLQSCFSESGVHLPVICTPEHFYINDHINYAPE